ncbi:ribokinase [Corynebacterium caspium]|uniref:ribokinase n=1 Tax=Corynebacterium caspium TaxID=234828 RepID=UPI00047588B2|nr:ribokinase [Corynebacterium caspium]WKD58948.1 Ribokinase [Corynebacterium caspium DSM 44850]
MSRIVVIGSINVDLSARLERHPLPGETVMGTSVMRSPGGKGANQALAAQLQGGQVALIGKVGADSDAPIALDLLEKAGVDLSGVGTGSVTGLAIIAVSDAGENTIVVIPGANHEVDEKWAADTIATLADDDVVVLQGELPRATTEALVRAAVARKIRVVLNVAPWYDLDREVLLAANPLVLNEHEAALAYQHLVGKKAQDHVQIAAEFLAMGSPALVITLGAAGSYIAQPDGSTQIPSLKTEVVDTTGAGDAFVGALVARITHGDDLVTAARYATRVSAYVVAHEGAQLSYPSLDDIAQIGQ